MDCPITLNRTNEARDLIKHFSASNRHSSLYGLVKDCIDPQNFQSTMGSRWTDNQILLLTQDFASKATVSDPSALTPLEKEQLAQTLAQSNFPLTKA